MLKDKILISFLFISLVLKAGGFYSIASTLREDISLFSCNKTSGEKEFAPCTQRALTCGQCIYYLTCVNGKYRQDECPIKRYRVANNHIVWNHQFFDAATKECVDSLILPVRGKCHAYSECRIIKTDFTINPDVWRYELWSENKCPSTASLFDRQTLLCANATVLSPPCVSKVCNITTCSNGGVCREKGKDEYSCLCPKGFIGPNCQVEGNPCTADTCLNGGTCYSHGTNQTQCFCQEGFEGAHCEKYQDYSLLTTLRGHTGPILSVAFHRDVLLASGSQDKTVKIWNAITGDLLRTLSGHTDRVNCVVFANGNLLASGSSDTTIKLWDINTGELIRTMTGHYGRVEYLVFNGDNILASACLSDDTAIRMWNANTGDLLSFWTSSSLNGDVTSLAFVSEKLLAVSGTMSTIDLWNIDQTPFLSKTLRGHTKRVWGLETNNQGLLASASSDSILIWDTATEDVIFVNNAIGDAFLFGSFALNKDNKFASHYVQYSSSGSQLNFVEFWDRKSDFGFDLMATLCTLQEDILSLAFSRRNLFASGSSDMTINIYIYN